MVYKIRKTLLHEIHKNITNKKHGKDYLHPTGMVSKRVNGTYSSLIWHLLVTDITLCCHVVVERLEFGEREVFYSRLDETYEFVSSELILLVKISYI